MKYLIFTASTVILLFTANSCRKVPLAGNDKAGKDSLNYNSDWTYFTHGNAPPDYSVVFPQETVNTIEITLGTDKWGVIRSNMRSLFGFDFGGNTSGGLYTDKETDYIDVLLRCNGKSWKNVGFRLKGNSSLAQAWGQGVYKLPFKLNFDKFADVYPGIINQHFYGFKELTFSPSFRDQSLLREKITSDIFRLAGVPASQTAFYKVYIDFGNGLKYCGVYTAVELPEDNMIKSQFGEERGNIYKPESRLQSFKQLEFEKKNNKKTADYSDVQSLITIINSSIRSSDPEQWRTNLENIFNVRHFLKYLAVNNAIVNRDSYGNMAHNYYLYNHSINKLMWIPWDHNEAMNGNPGITGAYPGTGQEGLSLSMNEVTNDWPLIRNIIDDPVYLSVYKQNLKSFNNNVFTVSVVENLINKYQNLIFPFVIGPDGEQPGYTYLTGSTSFTNAAAELKIHLANRKALITTYVP